MTAASLNCAILFANIKGSVSLYQKLGDRRALAAINTVFTELRKSVAFHSGRFVNTMGDELMAVLPSADAAMQTACDMQRRVAAIPPMEHTPLAIRVGFHFGPAIEQNGDFFGLAVKTAKRLTELAKGGQIITTASTVEALSPLLREATRDLDEMPVEGMQDEIRIFEVLWSAFPTLPSTTSMRSL